MIDHFSGNDKDYDNYQDKRRQKSSLLSQVLSIYGR